MDNQRSIFDATCSKSSEIDCHATPLNDKINNGHGCIDGSTLKNTGASILEVMKSLEFEYELAVPPHTTAIEEVPRIKLDDGDVGGKKVESSDEAEVLQSGQDCETNKHPDADLASEQMTMKDDVS